MDVARLAEVPPVTAAALRRLAGRRRAAWVCVPPGAAPDLLLTADSGCRATSVTLTGGRLGFARQCSDGSSAAMAGPAGATQFTVRGAIDGQPALTLVITGRRLAAKC